MTAPSPHSQTQDPAAYSVGEPEVRRVDLFPLVLCADSSCSLQISEEMLRLELEEFDSLDINSLVTETIEDFPAHSSDDEIDACASLIACASITEETRSGHYRYDWSPLRVPAV